MEIIEQMAEAAINRDSLRLRSLVQDWTRSGISVSEIQRPNQTDVKTLAVSAALVELLAERRGEISPRWTQEIGALAEPFFLVESATSMKRLKTLCETQSPEPLRRRRLYAPPHFLEFA
jgi:hypothetical protein